MTRNLPVRSERDADINASIPCVPTTLGLVLVAALGCATPAAERAAADPFAGTPADAPFPGVAPAPDGYRPTAAGAPATDIWVGRLVREGGDLRLTELRNATDRDGYDNQPAFVPGAAAFYYVSAVDTIQTEVLRYYIESGTSTPVTRTPDASEFSPNPVPGQDAFSAIHEQRGQQHLWRYRSDGTELGPIFSTAEPVGYHAWADESTTAMFILGSPATLRVGHALTGEIRIVAENPGRSIHRIPGTSEISFVRKVSEQEWWIERLDPVTGETERIVQTLAGREDYAWTPEGEILMGDGDGLYWWSPADGWREVEGVPGGGVISRLAVSGDGNWVAVVRGR